MSNKIYIDPETPTVFQPNNRNLPTGTDIPTANLVVFTPDFLPVGSGWISNQVDLGASPRASIYEWKGYGTFGNGTSIGGTLDMYISTYNSVIKDGSLPTNNQIILSRDKLRNLQFCGSLQCDSAVTPPDPGIADGLVEIYSRYISILWWNNTSTPLASGSYFLLTPAPDEVES